MIRLNCEYCDFHATTYHDWHVHNDTQHDSLSTALISQDDLKLIETNPRLRDKLIFLQGQLEALAVWLENTSAKTLSESVCKQYNNVLTELLEKPNE